MPNYALTGLAVKMVCPSNEVLLDKNGLPGLYVQRMPRKLSELLANCDDNSVHPAFRVGGSQINRLLIGKYQGKVHNNMVYSLPGEDPTAEIDLDQYVTYCRNKGTGHHCITAAEWAFLALCAKKDGKMPKGNNQFGKDIGDTASAQTAITTFIIPESDATNKGKVGRVATGTGPMSWSDTGDITGIWDLNGNVWEWVAGIRLVKGELQVIPDNNAAAKAETNMAVGSQEWKAINGKATTWDELFKTPDGKGTTTDCLKLDWVSGHWQWQTTEILSASNDSRSAEFFDTTTDENVGDVCKRFLRAMALLADDGAAKADYNGDRIWANNQADERCARRGGNAGNGADTGVFALDFDGARSNRWFDGGGRPAFYE